LRSLALESENLGLVGVVDLIENSVTGRELIDYKRGSARRDENNRRIPKDNDALQVGAYALLLAERGFPLAGASIYYAEERSRVPVELNETLYQKVRDTVAEAKAVARSTQCPPPLKDDPRCLHCSAYCVCLPNESAYWAGSAEALPAGTPAPRPPGDDGEVIVVQNPKAYLSARGGELHIKLGGETLTKHPLGQIRAVYLYGGAQYSTQVVHSLLERSIPLAHFSPAGRFLGVTSGLPQSGIDARLGQARLLADQSQRVLLTREIIRAKIHNQRVLLMRNGSAPDSVLKHLAHLRDETSEASSLDRLRGLEGAAAAAYFKHFATMLKGTVGEHFEFDGRNRRPPRDPLNALLSQGYSILAKEITGICHAIGLDPFIGFFHQPRYGRPALALDLMEEFRPLVADSVALSLLNRQELGPSDFARTSRGCYMTDSGRRQFWRSWFRRLDTEVTHPDFKYRMSYRRMLDVQARQLWRYLRGEATAYHPFITR
jgi:CRISPR-associated protein Cas1